MERKITLVLAMVVLISSSYMSNGQRTSHVAAPAPGPAPAPAPAYVNLTSLLSVAGPFHTFLNYLETTKVIQTFQNQANNTDEGITIFVPKDSAFSSLKKPSLANVTEDQLKQIFLFHALPHYYSLSDFRNLSGQGEVNTFAGGDYTLKFTDVSGTVHMTSGWSNTKISSSVFSTAPVALYQIDKVLLPEAIFGTDIPPAAAPAPAPDVAPVADSPNDVSGRESPLKSHSRDSSAGVIRVRGGLVLAVVGVLLLLLLL